MKIALASDHGGVELKDLLRDYLVTKGYEVTDFGTEGKESCDYPDFARPAAMSVAKGECDKGVIVCTTGIGVSIVANKVKGVRCALCTNVDMASMSRRHNDANVLAMGQKYVTFELAKLMTDAFLTTEFDGGRHRARVNKIE